MVGPVSMIARTKKANVHVGHEGFVQADGLGVITRPRRRWGLVEELLQGVIAATLVGRCVTHVLVGDLVVDDNAGRVQAIAIELNADRRTQPPPPPPRIVAGQLVRCGSGIPQAGCAGRLQAYGSGQGYGT
jgi:hypothetical protein